MPDVPWWSVVSSAAAPVVLAGGWAVAGELQPGHYDPVRQSVSVLAGMGATDRWVMTVAFVITSVCYIATGLGLRPAAPAGRLMLLTAGLAGVMVAASPEPASSGFSLAHAAWSTVGFTLLAAWPLCAWQRGPAVPWALRAPAAVGVAVVIVVLLAWFAAELKTGGAQIGLAERVAGEMQALWPLVVVVSCRLSTKVTVHSQLGSSERVRVHRSIPRADS